MNDINLLDFSDFNESNLRPSVLKWIVSHLPKGSKILELGSGKATRELSKFYNVISIEEDPLYCSPENPNIIYAPIVDGYYEKNKLWGILDQKFDLVIIDGPKAFPKGSEKIRRGFFEFIPHLKGNPVLIFDDIHRINDLLNFLDAFPYRKIKRVICENKKASGILADTDVGVSYLDSVFSILSIYLANFFRKIKKKLVHFETR